MERNTKSALLVTAVVLLAGCGGGAALAQESRTVTFSGGEGRPRILKADLLNGRITVLGHAGSEAIIRTEGGNRDSARLSVTEQNNVVTVGGAGMTRSANLVIQVPRETSLQLRCTNCGELRVENVHGDIDVHSVNGGIRLVHVGGSILAYTLNQGITAVIDRLDPGKSNSFSSMNGTIDCTFPPDLKANVKLRTENGRIHTDFDLRLGGPAAPIRTDRGINGTIGGGGPDLQFKAFNGSIYLRRK